MESTMFTCKGEWKTDLPVAEFAKSGIELEIKVQSDSAKLVTGLIDGTYQYAVRNSMGDSLPLGTILPVKNFVMSKLAMILETIFIEQGGDVDTLYRMTTGVRAVEGLRERADKIATHMNLQLMEYTTGLLPDMFFVDYSYEEDCFFVCWYCESAHLNEGSLKELNGFIHESLDDVENDDEILDYLD